MAFAGLANAKDRADVIAYLKSNAWAHQSNGKPIWNEEHTIWLNLCLKFF